MQLQGWRLGIKGAPMLRFITLTALICSSCAALLPAPEPMRAAEYPAPQKGRCLVVLLPGVGDSAETFDKQGFVEAARSQKLSADLLAANATLGYYTKETLWPRIKSDVLDPARARGYQKVWLVGISLGGMGTILTAMRDTQPPDGVLLLAPFLGDSDLINEISGAGGLSKWDPGPLPPLPGEKNYQRHAWRWLKESVAHDSPSVYLGFGTEDKLEAAARVLAAALPEDHVYTVSGKHNWATWRELWGAFLSRSQFAKECAEAP